MQEEILNAKITSASIHIDRGFLLTAWLMLEMSNGFSQGFGGYALHLDSTSKNHKQSLKTNFAGIFIAGVMAAAEVEEWSKLAGKAIRVQRAEGSIVAIGHIVNDQKWFNPKTAFEAAK